MGSMEEVEEEAEEEAAAVEVAAVELPIAPPTAATRRARASTAVPFAAW
jgi:hypothetical protein